MLHYTTLEYAALNYALKDIASLISVSYVNVFDSMKAEGIGIVRVSSHICHIITTSSLTQENSPLLFCMSMTLTF